ncbi:helix-turn-helix domain-containing protein [Staphylococcus auricularis]|uniref:helix-turn-helix domain-containing protein n=1 Tax=Staphylococcus auricularis TaxID=29379 RepID=UPI00242EFB33|nr:helix-turn-helix domain-containing protein [Staphylococcus auricularis]
MSSVGQTLKGRRERLGMTLNELEDRTQIKRDTLKLIENNDFYTLRHANYAEGFIEKYASAVNIDGKQLIDKHRNEIPSSADSIEEAIDLFQQSEAPSFRTKDKEPLQLIVIISTIVVITAIIWLIAMLLL